MFEKEYEYINNYLRKGHEQMNLMTHIKKAAEAFRAAYTAITAAETKKAADLKDLRQLVKDLRLIPAVEQEKYEKISKEYKTAMAALQADLSAKISKIEADYNADVEAYYMPSGSDINSDDLKLLNSGLDLSGNEIEKIIQRNADNLTMIRILRRYVEDHNIQISADCQAAFIRSRLAGSAEAAAWLNFKQLAGNYVRIGVQGMSDGDVYKEGIDRLDQIVADTEKALLNAKVYLDAETRKELLMMEEQKQQELNKANGTENMIYHNA